jgi:hypothetical protein
MSSAPLPLPDPLLTANVYCAGRLDEVLHRAVAPFWRGFRAEHPDSPAYLWCVRYPRGGEHLKLRLHAAEALRSSLRSSLEAAVSEALATLGTAPIAPAPPRPDGALPIDVEDESAEARPDASFLWTRYRRSAVSLGGGPLLDDDRYVGLLTRCLGAGCEKALDALQPDAQGNVPFRARQIALLKAVISGMASLGWSPERRSSYLAYHRNWLLRFVLTQSRQGPEMADEWLSRFDVNVARLGPARATLQATADAQWRGNTVDPGADDPWRESLRALGDHVGGFAGQPGYQIDPFSSDPVFPALFKALHGLGNQLGLKPSDESFTHHILLRLSAGEERFGFSLEPSTS